MPMAEAVRYEVGKSYRVPKVYGDIYGRARWWPVMGPKHEDKALIGFAPIHYHIDWRFVPESDYRRIVRGRTEDNCYAVVLQETYYSVEPPPERQRSIATSPNPNVILARPELRRAKCIREMVPYPIAHVERAWMAKLRPAYADCKMKNMICPHRGLPLDTLPVIDGVVTCPGHGLRWRVDTGEMVPA